MFPVIAAIPGTQEQKQFLDLMLLQNNVLSGNKVFAPPIHFQVRDPLHN